MRGERKTQCDIGIFPRDLKVEKNIIFFSLHNFIKIFKKNF